MGKIVNVKNDQQEHKSIKITNPYYFYQIMKYPIPSKKEFFAYKKKEKTQQISSTFSREQKNIYLESFLKFINKYHRLYRSLPFIEEIYLANSITFNALKPSSDIDLFVISKPWRVRMARLSTTIIMTLFRCKRGGNQTFKKFCLSFFIDTRKKNLISLSIGEKDIYLSYRVSHLVPIYQEKRNDLFFQENKWIKRDLPNFPEKQSIFLGINTQYGESLYKKIIETLYYKKIGDFFEKMIHKTRWSIIHYRSKKNKELHKDIIVSPYILKFHKDMRSKYSKSFFDW